MKIVYVSDSRLPTEKAHGFTQSKMCESLGRLGVEIDLIKPRRRTWIGEDLFDWYGLDRVFGVKEVWWPDTINKWSRILRTVWVVLQVRKSGQIYMTRNHLTAKVMTKLGMKFLFEKHSPIRSSALGSCVGIYDATELGSPVDPKEFEGGEARRLGKGKPVIGYVGNLRNQKEDKGVGMIVKIAKEVGIDYVIISNLPRKEALSWIKGLDAGFIGPLSESTHRGSGKAHPVKLREYMMAGVPVVAEREHIWPQPFFVLWTNGTLDDYVRLTAYAVEINPWWVAQAKKEALEWTWEKAGQKVVRLLETYQQQIPRSG